MIWQVLARLVLAHGRRLSWRDLQAHACTVPAQAQPEVAALTLRAFGVNASVQQLAVPAQDLQRLSLPVAMRLIGGEWLLLCGFDGEHVQVERFTPAQPTPQGDRCSSPASTDAFAQAPTRPAQNLLEAQGGADELADAAARSRTERWPLERLLALGDGVCIGVIAEQASASVSDPAEAAAGLGRGDGGVVNADDWFWGVFARLRAHYGDCVLAAVLVNVLSLAGSMFSMNVYDRIIPNAALTSLWTLAVGVGLAALLELGLRSLRAHVLDDAGKRADLALSSALLRQMLDLRPADRPVSSGQWASQLREFDAVRDFVSSSTLVALTDLPFAVMFVLVMAWIGGPLVWITLVAGALTVVVGMLTQWPIRRSVERYQYENTQKHAFLIETLERLETIDALGAASHVQGRWERLCAAAARSAMGTRMASALTANAAQFIQQLASVGLIVAGVYLILAGQLTTGALIGCSILASRVLSPMGQVAGLMARWQNTRMSFLQIQRLMRLPRRHEPLQTFVGWPVSTEGSGPDLELKDLRFRYPRTEVDVLRIGGLRLQAGQTVAVTGPVGSGKSTLLRVLAGLQWPTEGQLLVGGLAAHQISPAEWRAHVAWVGQDAVLFRGTLRENLLMAAPSVSDGRLLQVLRLCGLDRLAAAHPQGLDMPVGEGGQALSGGQRQWVALARALLADAPVLLLDEPTSAMDMGFEQVLMARLRTEFAGRLVVVSTHRPGPLALADRLLVLDAGQVVADGPRDVVLKAIAEGRVGRATSADKEGS